jgi:hypothetical protein
MQSAVNTKKMYAMQRSLYVLGIDRGNCQKMACFVKHMDPTRTHLKESRNPKQIHLLVASSRVVDRVCKV